MGRNKSVEKHSGFSPQELLKSREDVEKRLLEVSHKTKSLMQDYDALRLRRETWIVRKNAATKALKKHNTENMRTLLKQAELNIELVMNTINNVSPLVEKAKQQEEAAQEGLKAFQRLDVMVKTSNQASNQRADIDDIVRSIAQISLDTDIDLRGIKHAEYIIEARTELAMNKKITTGA